MDSAILAQQSSLDLQLKLHSNICCPARLHTIVVISGYTVLVALSNI